MDENGLRRSLRIRRKTLDIIQPTIKTVSTKCRTQTKPHGSTGIDNNDGCRKKRRSDIFSKTEHKETLINNKGETTKKLARRNVAERKQSIYTGIKRMVNQNLTNSTDKTRDNTMKMCRTDKSSENSGTHEETEYSLEKEIAIIGKIKALPALVNNDSGKSSDEEVYNNIKVPGELVLAYHTKFYYPGKVLQKVRDKRYKVLFCDGSRSTISRDKMYTVYEKGFSECTLGEIVEPKYSEKRIAVIKEKIKQKYREYKHKLDYIHSIIEYQQLLNTEMLSFNDRLRFEKFFRGKRSEWMVLEQLNSAGNLTFKLYEFFSLLIRDDYKTPPKLWSVSVKRLNRMKNKDTKYSRSKDFYQQNKSSFTDFDNQKNRDPSSQSTFSIENKKTLAPLVRSSSLPTGSLEFDNKGDGHIPDPVSLGKYSGQKLEVSSTLLSCSCTHISELFVDKVMVPSFFEHIRMLDAHPAVNESDDEDYSWVSKILEFRSLSK